jgi:phage shock protein A
MGIFTRLTDIINANLNALLEKAEDPEKIVRLVIQEMEDTLVEVRSSAARTIAEKKEMLRRIRWLEQEIIDWERKAEIALDKGREDLAKAALGEKARLSDQLGAFAKELDVVEQTLGKLSEDIEKLQAKLTDAKARQQSIVIRQKTASSQLRMRRQIYGDRIDDVMMRFEDAERRIDEMEGGSEAWEMGRKRGLAEQIADLESSDQLEKELKELKARVARAGTKSGKSTGKADK